jgi:Ribbon-helix-helix protein, copG family
MRRPLCHRCLAASGDPGLSLFPARVFLYYVLMVKSIIVIRKKRGRPATGQDPVMAVRLPQGLIERIEEWMKACDARSRSDAIRQLIELGLDRSVVKTTQPKKPRQQRPN